MKQRQKSWIFLVGMAGCGKSHIGYTLAQYLNKPFLDLDKEIEKTINLSVPEIFTQYGETFFRHKEEITFQQLLQKHPSSILATGGGAFMNGTIRKTMKVHGLSIWLKTPLKIIYKRIVEAKNTRPLFKNKNVKEELVKTAKKRYPIYSLAGIHIAPREKSLHDTTVLIAKILEEKEKHYDK